MKSNSSPRHLLCLVVIVISLLTLGTPSTVYSQQQVVENPNIGFSTANNLKIRKIELTDSFTILTFHIEYKKGDWIYIPKESYITPVGSDEKLYVIKADGIPMAERYTEGIADYDLYFQAIDKKTEKLDFGEGNNGGSWFIYDIELKKGLFERPIPHNLIGNWFATDGSKLLEVALYDTVAIYNSLIWKYGNVTKKAESYEIELINSQGKLTFNIEVNDSSSIRFSAMGQKPVVLKNQPVVVPGYFSENDQPYSLPVFQENAKAVYKGFIRNYSARYNQKTGQIHVNNIITGNQDSYMVTIQPDGTFSVEFPLCYPHIIFVRMPYFNESIFVEPGKETFHLIDGRDWASMHLFMGDMARVNTGLNEVRTIKYFNYDKAQDTIMNSTPEQYKAYCFQLRDWELPNLKIYADSNSISPKALQIKRYSLTYDAVNRAIEYTRTYESAYRKKNNIPREQRKLDIEIPKPDTSFYSFLNHELANDPLAVLSNEYGNFINRIKYHELLRPEMQNTNATDLIYEFVTKGEIVLTSEEELVLAEMKKLEDPEQNKQMREFYKKYTTEFQLFNTTYNDTLKQLLQDESFLLWHDIEAAFASKGILLSAKEIEMINAGKVAMPKETVLQNKQFAKLHGEAQNAMFTKYNPMINEYMQVKRSEVRDEKLQALFGINKGLATDLFASQDLCRGIVEEATPLENDDLLEKLKAIQDHFIAQYVVQANEATKEKLVKNKEKTGYYVNQTPTVESEKLFDALMAKFKGKVVVVDFWATWCGPCRSGMERIKPLKAELEGKDVVFVYITNETSPQGTWENMIPDIKGEHFKLNRDEWNVLSGRFNISGIPHYVLVDKNGIVANNNNLNIHNLSAFKAMLEDFMQK